MKCPACNQLVLPQGQIGGGLGNPGFKILECSESRTGYLLPVRTIPLLWHKGNVTLAYGTRIKLLRLRLIICKYVHIVLRIYGGGVAKPHNRADAEDFNT